MHATPPKATPRLILAGLCMALALAGGCDGCRRIAGKIAIRQMQKTANKIGERNAKVEGTVMEVLRTNSAPAAQAWQQFLREWPDTIPHTSLGWYKERDRFEGIVQAASLVEDRYLLKVIIDFQVSSNLMVVTFPRTTFHFAEIKRVILPPEGPAEGGISTTFRPDQKEFGLPEWQTLVSSGWDFSKIGITVVSNSPVPNARTALPYL